MGNQNKQEFVASHKPCYTFEEVFGHYEPGVVLSKVHNNFERITMLIENYDNLSDKWKLKLLLSFNYFTLVHEDLVKLVNKKYNKNFSDVKSISTNIIASSGDDSISQGGLVIGRGIVIDCATTDDLVLEDRRYSYDEIMNLINDGKIYPLFLKRIVMDDEFNKEETNTQRFFVVENNEKDVKTIQRLVLKDKSIKAFVPDELKIGKSYYDEFYVDEHYLDDENSKLFMQFFGPYLTKEEVLKRAKKYISELEKELIEITCYKGAFEEKELIRDYYKENFGER